MQQDTYFYNGTSTFPQNTSALQYQNPNSYMQPNVTPWSSNYIPDVNNLMQPNLYSSVDKSSVSYGSPPQIPPLLTPVSTAGYGTSSTFSWAHTVPSLMPWVPKGDAGAPDPVVRFTAPFPPDPCTSQTATSWELLNNLGANKTNANMHLKRKGDIDVPEAAPQKVCITEERMAARLRMLHISNQYSVPSEDSPFGPFGESSSTNLPDKSVTNLKQLEYMMNDSKAGGDSRSLVLAPELKKLVEPDKIFASTFLDKIERPSMAVVLWQPQNSMLLGVNNNSKSDVEEKKEKTETATGSTTGAAVNNNFLPGISDMCDESASFISSENSRSQVNSDDIMDT